MKIVFKNYGRNISSTDLESDVVIAGAIPPEAQAALNAGKTVWYIPSSYVNNAGSKVNANKKIRLGAAGRQGSLGDPGSSVIAGICAIEEHVGNPKRTALSANPGFFGIKLVSEKNIYFSARQLEKLDPAEEMHFYATAHFFIPE